MKHAVQRIFAATMLAAMGLATSVASANIIDTPVGGLHLSGTQHADVLAGASISSAYVAGSSSVSVQGGHIGFLNVVDQASARINGGDISWILPGDNASVALYGADSISWLILDGKGAHAEVFADNLQYAGGHLSGVWANGQAFSFWALERDASGDLVMPASVLPSGITLHSSVPEPSTFALMGIGMLAAGWRARRAARSTQ